MTKILNNDYRCNTKALIEAFILHDISKLDQSKIYEFCSLDGVGDALCKSGFMNPDNIAGLQKTDDTETKVDIAVLRIAIENNDPLFDELVKSRNREKELLELLSSKYRDAAVLNKNIAEEEYQNTVKDTIDTFINK